MKEFTYVGEKKYECQSQSQKCICRAMGRSQSDDTIQTCEKAFSQMGNLKTLERINAGECKTCQKTFSDL